MSGEFDCTRPYLLRRIVPITILTPRVGFTGWSPEKLRTLTSALQKGMKNGQLPAESDTEFWSKLPFADDDDELVEDVRSELQSAELQTTPLPGVFLGDLSCAESRLSLLTNSITSIVYIASHQMEPLWAGDGLNYHTITVSPAIEPSKTHAYRESTLQKPSVVLIISPHPAVCLCAGCCCSSPARRRSFESTNRPSSARRAHRG